MNHGFSLLTSDIWPTVEEFLDAITLIERVDERLNWNSGPRKANAPA
jgi:hypothetical protein